MKHCGVVPASIGKGDSVTQPSAELCRLALLYIRGCEIRKKNSKGVCFAFLNLKGHLLFPLRGRYKKSE